MEIINVSPKAILFKIILSDYDIEQPDGDIVSIVICHRQCGINVESSNLTGQHVFPLS